MSDPQAPLIFGCAGPILSKAEAAFFHRVQPFGFILFARNVETPIKLTALCADLRAAVGWHAPILIDQEGGRVQRMGPPHWSQFPPPLDDAEHPAAQRLFWLRGRIIAHELMSVGVDVNCAPTMDVVRPQTHPFLRNRCYGGAPDQVIRLARAMSDGQEHGGILSVMKHMPGHGLAEADSHKDLPKVDMDADALFQSDFAPFKALNDLPMGMTAHIRFTALDDQVPATQSDRMITLIRENIGFSGLLMTDDISMEALDGDVVTRAQASWAAGCDVVLHCNGKMDEMTALANASPGFSIPSQRRVHTVLQNRPQAQNIDISAVKLEFETLSGTKL